MAQMETTAYYAFAGPIYLGVVALEYWVSKRRGLPTLRFAPSFGNLSAGLGAIAVGLFLGPALVLLYEWGYAHLAVVHWEAGSPVPWVLALVLADLGHYLHHRLDHRVAACWAIHGVHHQPEEMNFTVAMRHAWFSDLYSFPFYAMLPLVGVPTAHFFVATTLLSFHALITHSERYSFPSLGIFVTPRSHVLHHARNPAYIDKNFGAMLCVWDKLFGTHVEWDPAVPPEYGATRAYATHDGMWSQAVFWRDLLHLARRAPTWGDRARVFLSRPGWAPEGVALPAVQPPPATVSPWMKAYVSIQFLAVVVASHWVFLLREAHAAWVTALGAAAIFAALASFGALLDRRPWAWPFEVARVVVTAGLVSLAWGG